MNVSLTPELEAMVNEKVSSGLYTSASEVIREALRLLLEQEEVRRLRIEELRRELQLGAEQLKKGKFKEYRSGEELMNDIRSRGTARARGRK